MALISLEELSREISVPVEFIADLVNREVITPYGGRARLGEPKFSSAAVSTLRTKVAGLYLNAGRVAAR